MSYSAIEYITADYVAEVENVTDSSLFVYDDLRWGWEVTNDESLVLTDPLSIVLGVLISDWITLIDTQSNNWNGKEIFTDTLNLYDIASFGKAISDTINESLVITDVATYKLVVGILEHLGFTDLAAALITTALTASDSLTLADVSAFFKGYSDTINESLTLADTTSYKLFLLLMESLRLTEQASAQKSAAEAVSETIAITDSSAHALMLFISEALSAVDTVSVVATFLRSISDSLAIADTLSNIARIYGSLAESLVLAESVTIQGTLYTAVYDTIAMNVLVELADDVYECYVLNTPKFMPSMYSGFDFNSYAVFENRAFGANSTGIYELTGETDAGANISTGVIMSQTDFGSPNQKRFRRGYVGISGTNPVMVLETEDGSREAYAIDTNGKFVASHDLKGKKWKLSVADFDELDCIKLIPVILTK